LGLYHRDRDYGRLCPDCMDYYHRFVRRFGSSKCRDIIGLRFKVGYDVRRFFLKGIRCLTVVYTSIASVFDIIEKGNQRPASTRRYQISPPFDMQRFACASVVLSQIGSQLKADFGSILKAARGFSGGIAFQGDICGAFMGAVLALGSVYGTEPRRRQRCRIFKAGLVTMKEGSRAFQREHLHPSFKTSLRVGRLYKQFVSTFGSADCMDILGSVSSSQGPDGCEKMPQTTAQLALDFMDVPFEAAQ